MLELDTSDCSSGLVLHLDPSTVCSLSLVSSYYLIATLLGAPCLAPCRGRLSWWLDLRSGALQWACPTCGSNPTISLSLSTLYADHKEIIQLVNCFLTCFRHDPWQQEWHPPPPPPPTPLSSFSPGALVPMHFCLSFSIFVCVCSILCCLVAPRACSWLAPRVCSHNVDYF